MKVKVETVRRVKYRDLDDAVSKFYGQKFNVVSDQEWGNDTSYNVSAEVRTLDKWDQETVDKFKASGRHSFALNALLSDMANHGEIEPGEYIVDVCW